MAYGTPCDEVVDGETVRYVRVYGSEYSGMPDACEKQVRDCARHNEEVLGETGAALRNALNGRAVEAFPVVRRAVDEINASGIVACHYGVVERPQMVQGARYREHDWIMEVGVQVVASQFGRPMVSDCVLVAGDPDKGPELPMVMDSWEMWSHENSRIVLPGDAILSQDAVVAALVRWLGHEGATARDGLRSYLACGHVHAAGRIDAGLMDIPGTGTEPVRIELLEDADVDRALAGRGLDGFGFSRVGGCDGRFWLGADDEEGSFERLFEADGRWGVWLCGAGPDGNPWMLLAPEGDDARLLNVYRAATCRVPFHDIRSMIGIA